MRTIIWLMLSCALWCFALSACAGIAQTDHDLVDRVSTRLLTKASIPQNFAWPPTITIEDKSGINAYSTLCDDTGNATQHRAKVVIFNGLLQKIVQGDDDRLAFILGHELAHIELGHILNASSTAATPFLRNIFSREQEIAADQRGMQLALAAGYSYQQALGGIKKMMALGLDYTSFEGLGVNHPSWKERLTQLDKDQSELWGAMSAFDNGVLFLQIEQYGAAERCFRRVSREFPACHEAWANLGYALLMQYCDALDADDLKRFAVGEIVCGGFYRRPETLEAQVRGVDDELWWDAVGALREALRLHQEDALTAGNLGIAYLVCPAGSDTGKSMQYFHTALTLANDNPKIDPFAYAALLMNASVADYAGGDVVTSTKHLNDAETANASISPNPDRRNAGSSLRYALLYNRALLMTKSTDHSEQAKAIKLFETYLHTASSASAWWHLGYASYQDLCRQHGVDAVTPEQLQKERSISLRPVVSVTLQPECTLALTEPMTEVQKCLGSATPVSLVTGTNLMSLTYPMKGIEVIGAEQILAIRLTSPKAPAIQLRSAGLGGQQYTLHLGMTRTEWDMALGDEEYDFRQLLNNDINYRFYQRLGLAVRISAGIVQEIAIVQIPEREIFNK